MNLFDPARPTIAKRPALCAAGMVVPGFHICWIEATHLEIMTFVPKGHNRAAPVYLAIELQELVPLMLAYREDPEKVLAERFGYDPHTSFAHDPPPQYRPPSKPKSTSNVTLEDLGL